MLASLSNCTQCQRAFSDYSGRGMCPTCFGQKVFGRPTLQAKQPEPEPVQASAAGLQTPEHTLRCDKYAQKGRAHEPSSRRGLSMFW